MFASDFCATCYSRLLASFNQRHLVLNGRGLLAGRLRPDYGPTFGELKCCSCSSQWVGPIGEPCDGCRRDRETLLTAQAEHVLEVPDVDVDDAAYDGVLRAWAERLGRAVTAGLVSERRARQALARVEGAAHDRAA